MTPIEVVTLLALVIAIISEVLDLCDECRDRRLLRTLLKCVNCGHDRSVHGKDDGSLCWNGGCDCLQWKYLLADKKIED